MSGMTPDEALMIVDPDTREAALTRAKGCRPLRAEYIAEACRVLAADYRKLREGLGLATAGLAGALANMRAERDAAVQALTYVAKTSEDYDCNCKICTGGLSGSCDWPDGVDMPVDACEKCGKCRCAQCCDRSQWEWRGLVKENKA